MDILGKGGREEDRGKRQAGSAIALGDMSWLSSLRLGLMGGGFMTSWRDGVPGCRTGHQLYGEDTEEQRAGTWTDTMLRESSLPNP